MNLQTIDKMDLFGTDAIRFANALYRPTHDMVKSRKAAIDAINDSVTLVRHDDGYDAEIQGLDILKDVFSNKTELISLFLPFQATPLADLNCNDGSTNASMITVLKNDAYKSLIWQELLSCAA